MKKNVVRTMLFMLLLITVTELTKAQTLVASYPFNGNANDASGNGYNGTVNGATLTTDRFGNANSAYYFDGVSAFIQGSAANYPTGDRTISLWFNADAGTIATHPALLGYGGGVCGSSFIMGINNVSSSGKYQTQGHCNTNSNQYAYPASPENNWYNWVITVNGTTSKMYINGVLVSTAATFTTTTTVTGTDFIFGNIVNTNGVGSYGVEPGNVSYYKGKLDDIKIYSGALSDAQIFDLYIRGLKRPGSGTALSFDGTNGSVSLPDDASWDFGSGDFAIEAWIKLTNNSTNRAIVSQSNTGGTGSSAFYLGTNYNGPGSLQLYTSNSSSWTHGISSPSGALPANAWAHVCVTRESGVAAMYINGVSQTLSSGGAPSLGIAPTINNSSNSLYVGNQNGTSDQMDGQIDEVRIFKGAGLTQTQVRDWMCSKITSSHPKYLSLATCLLFDEGSGAATAGYNAIFGTLNGSSTWTTSGAPLGDAAAHDFVNATKTANISAASGENFEVTSTSGSPSGILVYRVDEAPNSSTGANNGGNNKYFGVFQSGGTSPQYTAVYNYTGNPLVNGGNESSLRLAKRTDNSVTIWTQMSALPNEAANTITVTGESTEYILGSVGPPLPVTLINFAGSKCNNNICLLWSTENEQNFSHFEVEKSNNGNNFSYLTSMAARNQAQRNTYTSTDIAPFNGANFYRLKIVNIDGSFSYSRTINIDLAKPGVVTVQPNPANEMIIIKGIDGYTQLRIMDIYGRLHLQQRILHGIEAVNISSLPSGMYLVELMNEKETTNIKLIKQ